MNPKPTSLPFTVPFTSAGHRGRAAVRIGALALAVAGALGTAAVLAQPAGGGMRHGPPGMGMPGGEAMMLERLNALRNKLSLTPEQGALWDKAQQLAKATRDEARPQHEAMRARMAAALDSGTPSPRELFAEIDKLHEAQRGKRLAVREAWLKVYESLNANQQSIVRLDIKEHMQRMPRMGPPPGRQ